jgi:hypothetical protein
VLSSQLITQEDEQMVVCYYLFDDGAGEVFVYPADIFYGPYIMRLSESLWIVPGTVGVDD